MSYIFYNCYIESCDKWGRYKIVFKDATPETKNIIASLRNTGDTDDSSQKLKIYDWFFYAKPGKILEKKDFLEKKYADIELSISQWVYKDTSGKHFIMKCVKNIR